MSQLRTKYTSTSQSSDKPNTVETLRQALSVLGLDTRGHKSELKKRLRMAQKKKKEPTADFMKVLSITLKGNGNEEMERAEPKDRKGPGSDLMRALSVSLKGESNDPENTLVKHQLAKKTVNRKKQVFDYYLCFDVEATCESNGGFDFQNEIIEFPVVLLDGKTFEIVDEFHSYVKPSINPTLSEFCISLTGIQQETVDAAPLFPDVLVSFQEFLDKHSLFQEKSAAFITDGPYDIRDFITKQVSHSKISRPFYFSDPWVDIRMLFQKHYKLLLRVNIDGMLHHLGMSFSGRKHSGIDDARNVARIARRLWEDGGVLKCNRTFSTSSREKKFRKSYW